MPILRSKRPELQGDALKRVSDNLRSKDSESNSSSTIAVHVHNSRGSGVANKETANTQKIVAEKENAKGRVKDSGSEGGVLTLRGDAVQVDKYAV